ncbi:hypothetical protein NEUTE1DRAFT_138100 [Neurospora tetrasperma FGSC 2508]|uniref:Uncharacterized protein n=1 Tax=Neurospora tetrasperma (strain FGSC 2508 / ATCC MYA-4615 / P0657) TaxID=510951 RepID=F8ML98_NEUT8|nr:uncharacterized protein NEUTE1DRAFT_138100 [Neurospora tetrasperma FGSC 2508]EGO58371.1 hypothetical protein NEUTE1DRAFT_138100 [Neurospora tetrasperma FGSC 2508]EGZ71302.1 hypothetical protein NEUTE2DRAFT_166374 [Neurospora tetrasperma FGSC 2509]
MSTKWKILWQVITTTLLMRLNTPNSLRAPLPTSIKVTISTYWMIGWEKPRPLSRLNLLLSRTARIQRPPSCLPLDDDNLAIDAVLEQQDDVEIYPDDIPFVNEHFLSQQYNLLPQVES